MFADQGTEQIVRGFDCESITDFRRRLVSSSAYTVV